MHFQITVVEDRCYKHNSAVRFVHTTAKVCTQVLIWNTHVTFTVINHMPIIVLVLKNFSCTKGKVRRGHVGSHHVVISFQPWPASKPQTSAGVKDRFLNTESISRDCWSPLRKQQATRAARMNCWRETWFSHLVTLTIIHGSEHQLSTTGFVPGHYEGSV